MKLLFIFLTFSMSIGTAFASEDFYESLNPSSQDIEKKLLELDQDYIKETGRSPWIFDRDYKLRDSCYRDSCRLWIDISKKTQTARIYLDGVLEYEWQVSTGVQGYSTPNFDRHPNGRIYDAYSSKKYPGGDYQGLGNMPYAVFIKGGYAFHGTPVANWKKLGKKASHGCIRVHPDNARFINETVRRFGRLQTWFTVR